MSPDKKIRAVLEEVDKYIKDVRSSTGPIGGNDFENLVIGLMVQINLQLSQVRDLLLVATGLDKEDIPENDPSKISDVPVSKGMVCGVCGKGIIPDAMGYCPICNSDLNQQFGRPKLNG
ncbi:hypothetical protein MEO43_25390 [Dolichospermum sp. ST_sed5]|nr:hypothetical protein [Dolichospermum sp. ST_sed5]